jgi:HlyD family secretion protein
MMRLVRNRKLLAGAAFVLLLLAIAFWPQAAVVDVAPVARGSLQVTVDDEGETRVRDRYVVSAPVAGRLLRIELEPGDPVRRGADVASLSAAPPGLLDTRTRAEATAAVDVARAAVGRAQAERQRLQAVRDRARSDLERSRQLAPSGIVSRDALEMSETNARAAEEALRAAAFAAVSAESDLERARAVLVQGGGTGGASRTVVLHAPVDGVVLKRLRESEAVVPAGEPLLELGDPRALEIVSDLLSVDAVKVRPGQKVLIEHWGGEHALAGRVRRVEPSGFLKISALGVEEQRVNVIVDFEDPAQAAALGDGYRVEVRVVVWEGPDVVKTPTSSLFRQGDQWAVFIDDGSRARLRTVEIGQRNGNEAQVLSGLAGGERVIVHPGDTLHDGSRIRASKG